MKIPLIGEFFAPRVATVQEQLATKLAGLESELASRYLESIELAGNFVDPRSRFFDADGTRWIPIGGGSEGASPTDTSNVATEDELTEVRDYCRNLARRNPYAINLHENLVSFVVGEGHKYSPVAKKDKQVSESELTLLGEALDAIQKENKWCRRQQEIVFRLHRDGEVFIRKFLGHDGITRFRFIEPFLVRQPPEETDATFGIETDPEDVETVIAYWIAPAKQGEQWERVVAAEIQHRKANVDSNVKRGIPTTWPIGVVLERVAKLTENMGAISNLQTSIAAIRYHKGATKQGLENFTASKADFTRTNPVTGKSEKYSAAGRRVANFVDVSDAIKYEFPPSPDVSGWVEGASFNLRSAASRICFPEFMLTSDASNSNYASTMVAEGPASRMFQRMQAGMKEDDLELLMEALGRALGDASDVLARIEIQCEAPTVEVRDEKAEADTNKVYVDMGIMSKQTVSASIGLDYQQEQANIAQHEKEHPDQMKQAELQVMQAQADPALQKPVKESVEWFPEDASFSARVAAMEAYYGGESFTEHCGANGPGGKGFQPGNTCGADGGGESERKDALKAWAKRDKLTGLPFYSWEYADDSFVVNVGGDQPQRLLFKSAIENALGRSVDEWREGYKLTKGEAVVLGLYGKNRDGKKLHAVLRSSRTSEN